MYLFHFFRSFLPLHNTIGFGASDFVELALALVLVLFAVARPWLVSASHKLAPKTRWCMFMLFALPIGLRLMLLPVSPVPTPSGSDDFSFLLLADTLAHFRLANPPHPFHQFFESIFVLQQPTYSSIYPLGRGLVLALGQLLFGHPWAGVLIATGAFSSLCYWMLRAWIAPDWALLGSVLAAFEFGPLCYWMNSYWGGAVAAAAGCLVFGSLPRLHNNFSLRDSVLLGLGLAIHLLTRPYESIFLVIGVVLFFLPSLRTLARPALITALSALPFFALMLLHNKQVTGHWTTLPYMLYRYEYGVPPTFTFQPNAVPHRALTPEQELDYRANAAIHGDGQETLKTYAARLYDRVRFYRFFLFAPLYLVLPSLLGKFRQYRFLWIIGTLLIFALGANFYPFFYPHYISAVTCLFVLVAVKGLESVSRLRIGNWMPGPELARLITFLCVAHFLFWYGIHISGNDQLASGMAQFESWDFINYGDPEGRVSIDTQLAALSGKQLVFVRYAPQHLFREWIRNPADIDQSRVVWARDLGSPENDKLRRYYPDRKTWLLEPDARPPRLTPLP